MHRLLLGLALGLTACAPSAPPVWPDPDAPPPQWLRVDADTAGLPHLAGVLLLSSTSVYERPGATPWQHVPVGMARTLYARADVPASALTWTPADSGVVRVVRDGGGRPALVGLSVGRTDVVGRDADGGVRDRIVANGFRLEAMERLGMPRPPSARHLDGLDAVASARVTGRGPARRLVAAVTLSNPGREPVRLALSGCPLGLSVHGEVGYAGLDLLELRWASPDPPRCGRARTLRLGPGERHTLTAEAALRAVVGDDPPAYPLAVAVHLLAPGRRIAFGAGDLDLGPGPLALTLDAAVHVGTGAIALDARVVNQEPFPLRVGWGSCSLRLLGWRTADRSGPPDFDTARRQPLQGDVGYACTLELRRTALAPGAELAERLVVPLDEVLADSLPDGRYHLTAQFDLAETAGPGGTGVLQADLGPVDLALGRPPLAAQRTRLGARFTVDSARTADGRLTALVRVTPAAGNGPSFAGFAPCAVSVLAYRDERRRDEAPRAGPPDARLGAACGQGRPVAFTRPGASEPADPPLYLGASAPLTLRVDVALDALRDASGARPPFLALAVHPAGSGFSLGAFPPVYLRLDPATH